MWVNFNYEIIQQYFSNATFCSERIWNLNRYLLCNFQEKFSRSLFFHHFSIILSNFWLCYALNIVYTSHCLWIFDEIKTFYVHCSHCVQLALGTNGMGREIFFFAISKCFTAESEPTRLNNLWKLNKNSDFPFVHSFV